MSENGLMQGYPPPADRRVTLTNWRLPPFNPGALPHGRQLVPTPAIGPAPGPARSRKPLVAVAAALIAVGGIYSLAAPWPAQRQLATAASASAVGRALGRLRNSFVPAP